MKQSEVSELSNTELRDKLEERQNSLEKLLMTHAVSALENPLKIRHERRVVARLKTEIVKRESK